MITCCAERAHDCLEELKPLFQPHWEELALDKDKVPLDPDYQAYLEAEDRGELLLVVARDAGKVVGYFVGFVRPHLNYRTCIVLQMAIFWLAPEYRDEDSLGTIEREMLCTDLFDLVKREAVARGVQRPYYGSKFHKDASGLFETLGMHEVERYYSAWWGS